jgi:hypothetical protein
MCASDARGENSRASEEEEPGNRYVKVVIEVRRRDGRAVEGARLESVYTLTGIVGSNPTLSAIHSSAKSAPLPQQRNP